MISEDVVLSAVGLSKSYGRNTVLRDVDFALRDGEIHALLGANGAGKSTFIKVLAGVVPRDEGSITVLGDPLPAHFTGREALHRGLAFVHQDLGLIESLTVAENVALVAGFEKRAGLVSAARTERRAVETLERLRLRIDPGAAAGSLSQDERVLVAVARAFSMDARIVVLDEVSSSLPAPDVERLTGAIREICRPGHAFVYVTHRLDELDGFADRVTVLRDGRQVWTGEYDRSRKPEIIEAILGESVPPTGSRVTRSHSVVQSTTLLEVDALQDGTLAAPLTFTVAAGEILGICGLFGSGTRDVAALLGGARRPASGAARLDGRELPLGNVPAMRNRGCGFVPGDRIRDGAVADLTVQENLYLAALRGASRWVGTRTERRSADALATRFSVKPAGSAARPLGNLSGGNQQKVVVARAMRTDPRLLVVEDLTAGVDVGARSDLHRMLSEHRDAGAAVVLVSTDYEEVAELADRVLVMSHGEVVAEFEGADVTPRSLAVASYSGSGGLMATDPDLDEERNPDADH